MGNVAPFVAHPSLAPELHEKLRSPVNPNGGAYPSPYGAGVRLTIWLNNSPNSPSSPA